MRLVWVSFVYAVLGPKLDKEITRMNRVIASELSRLISHDFRLSYVASYSGRDLPFYYLFSTFWAGQEGSFLLWCFWGAIIGLFVCSLVLLFGTRAETSAWAAVNFTVMFSGIYYPVSVLPEWAQVVAAGIPLTYFLDAFRQGYGFEAQFAHAWLKGFALTGLYVVLAHWALASAITRSRRTGLLLKLSE